MSNAETDRRFAPRSTVVPSYEERTARVPSYRSEEDQVAWPPVIARIRDLDKPAATVGPAPSPAPTAETPPSSNSVVAKPVKTRRVNQNISSRLIALAGVVIFIIAIVPFMHMRDKGTSTETTTVAWPPVPPAPNAGLAPAWPGGGGTTAGPAEKSSSQTLSSPQAALTNNVKPSVSAALSAPLLALPEKKELTAVAPPNPPAIRPQEQIAAKPPTPPTITNAATVIPPANSILARQPTGDANHVAEIIGEFDPMPGANPAKADPAKPDNRTPGAAQELSNISLPPMANGLAAPPVSQNQPMVSDTNLPTGTTAPPPANPNVLPTNPANGPRPATVGPGADPRLGYPMEADVRNDYRPRYNPLPDYRRPVNSEKPPPSGQIPANGQYPPANGQLVPPNAQLPQPNLQYQRNQYPNGQNPNGQFPPPNVRGGTMPPQNPTQFNPSQPASSPYPPNQPTPSNPPATAGAWQNGVSYPPPAYNNGPNAVPPTAVNPINRDGYSIPPTNENPPARY
jgi:hypothetical protein